MIYLIAVGCAVFVAAVHWLIFRAMYRTESGTVRGLLMTAKLLLWAGFFACMAWIELGALLVGAAVASVLYVATGLYWLRRMRARLKDHGPIVPRPYGDLDQEEEEQDSSDFF